MPSKIIEVPGVGNVEFPDSMPDGAIAAVLKAQYSPKTATPRADDAFMRARASMPKPAEMRGEHPVNAFTTRLMTKVADLPAGIVKGLPPGQAIERTGQFFSDLKNYGWQGPPQDERINRAVGSLGIDRPQVAEDTRNANWGGLGAEVAAPILQVLAGSRAIKKGASVPASELNAPKVPTIAPAEATARQVTKAVNPAVNEWNGYIEAIKAEGSTIADYAKRTGNPLKTQLEFAKAARGAAEEAHAVYRETMLNPVADKVVSVAGKNYKGSMVGEGPNARLADIDKRIGDINDTLRSAYQKKEAGQVMTALENESALQAEKVALTEVLHREIAKNLGIQPEQVAAQRQKFGRMYSVSDQTTAAVNQRQSSAGKAGEGRRDIPVTTAGAVAEAWNKMRGGPEAIADKNFRRALKARQSVK
jgi:hypothetical protein